MKTPRTYEIDDADWSYGNESWPLLDFIEMLQEIYNGLDEEGRATAKVAYKSEGSDYGYSCLKVTHARTQTAEEVAAEQEHERREAERTLKIREQRERSEFERLSKKFGA